MRSFARARSSSRRAPPIAASNPCSSIASSSVTVWSWLRDARGPVWSRTRPRSIESCTLATTRRSPSSATRRSRNSITSGKLWPVSTCMIGNGNRAGRNAFSASRSSTIESLPPEKSSTGRSRSAATSRMMWIASDSSSSRCDSVLRASTLTPASPCSRGCRTRSGPCPPSGPRGRPRLRRVRVADRRVAAVVERVVRQAALPDVPPAVVVAPVGERVRLPELVHLVPAELRRVRARRRLRAAERLDLRDSEVEVGIALPEPLAVPRRELLGRGALEHLDRRRVAALDLAPELVRLREEVVGIDREHARVRLEPEEHVEQHRLLLLEGARERDPPRPLLQAEADDLLGRHRLDLSRLQIQRLQGAPPSTCRRAARAAASRSG